MKASNKKDYRHEDNVSDNGEDDNEDVNIVVEDGDAVDEKKIENEFDVSEAVEKITEKRATIREKGLESFVKYLRSTSQTPFKDAIANYEETLFTLLARILKRPTNAKEGKLCCELLCLLALTQGANEDDFFSQFETPLKHLVAGGSIEELREYALFTLTFLSYVCSNEANEGVWYLCEQILTDSAEALPYTVGLKATAAECWLLLATVMSEQSVAEHSADEIFESLLQLMEESASVPGEPE